MMKMTQQRFAAVAVLLVVSHLLCCSAGGALGNFEQDIPKAVLSAISKQGENSQHDRSLQPEYEFTEQCKTDTESDLMNLLGIIQATSYVNQWVETRQFDDFCSNQNDQKTTCVLDFKELDHTLESACFNVGAIYMTTDYVYRCTVPGSTFQFFYKIEQEPSCVAYSCGEEGSYGMQEANVDGVGEVLATETGMECRRLRLDMSVPIIPVQRPKDCAEDTQFLMAFFQNATDQIASFVSTDSPLSDFCMQNETEWSCNVDLAAYNNNNTESMTTECNEMDGMYIESDYMLSCNKTGDSNETLTMSTTNHPLCVSTAYCGSDDFPGLISRNARTLIDTMANEGWFCEMGDDTPLLVDDFAVSSSPTVSPAPTASPAPSSNPTISPMPSASPAPSSSPTDLGCLASSIEINTAEDTSSRIREQNQAIEDQFNAIAFNSYCRYPASENAVPYIVTCDIDYGMFQNDLKSACDEQGDSTLYVENTITLVCENDDDREIRVNLIDRPGCRSDSCNGKQLKEVDAYELKWLKDNLEASNADVNFECDFERVNVAIGGVEAMGSSDLTEACTTSTNVLDTTIAIYNQKQRIHADFEEYAAVRDLRDICISPEVDYFVCDVDFASFTNGLVALCEESGGNYVESAFVTECQKDDREFTMLSENVPSCLGTMCSPAQGLQALQPDSEWIGQHYEDRGWTCATTVIDVYAKDFEARAADPSLGGGEDPWTSQTGNGGDASTTDSESDSLDDLLQGGPNFGVIWMTSPPTQSPPTMEPTPNITLASSGHRLMATAGATVLLGLPMIFFLSLM